jgi:hypothetical protein
MKTCTETEALCKALRRLIDAAQTVAHACDTDIYTDAPECETSVKAAHDALGVLQGAIGRALKVLSPLEWKPIYSPWRHGGWYVHNVQYPNGAIGCVSRNYPDKKWRIACDSREGDHTYPNRDAAARAEYELAKSTPR